MALKVRETSTPDVIKMAIRNRMGIDEEEDFYLTKRGRDYLVNDQLDTGSYTLTLGTLIVKSKQKKKVTIAEQPVVEVKTTGRQEEVDEEESEKAEEETQEEEEEKSTGSTGALKPMAVSLPQGYTPKRRRGGVSAESDKPNDSGWTPKPIAKTQMALRRIRKATSRSFLFNSLSDSQKDDIYDCMKEIKVTKGQTIIKQYDDGDYFYVVDSGHFDVLIQENPESTPVKRFTYKDSGSFGEISLMYNSPRTASVVATTDGVLWAVDRATFRHIVVANASRQSKQREKWLKKVDILSNLSQQEVSQIADFLVTTSFSDNEYVIRRGEQGDMFYIIEEGEAVATITNIEGEEQILRKMGPGEYFGERALITNEARSANVKAVGSLRVAGIDRATFERLFGNARGLLNSRMKNYVVT
jgi:cAMP-dependent protein kinase regulator